MKLIIRSVVVLGVLALGAVLAFRAGAFNGPTQGGGSGTGAVAVDTWSNIVVGSTTITSSTRAAIFGSTTDSSYFGLKVSNKTGGPVLWARNDGKVSVATSSFSTTSTLRVAGYIETTSGGLVFPDGTIQTSASISGTSTPAANVTAGAFGSAGVGGYYSFPAGLSVGTTTIPTAQVEFMDNAIGNLVGLHIMNILGTGTTNTAALQLGRAADKPMGEIRAGNDGAGSFANGSMSVFTRKSETMVEVLRLGSAGAGSLTSFGIGTSTPEAQLHVYGAGASPILRLQEASGYLDVDQASNGRFFVSSTSPFDFNLAGSSRLYIATSTGYVGIGTSSPQNSLHVKGSPDANYGQLRLQSTQNNTGVSFYTPNVIDQTNGRNWQIQNNYQAYGGLSVMRSTSATGTPTTAVMEFDKVGNVGIGTAAPTTMTTSGATLVVLGGICIRNATACPSSLTAGALRVDTAGSVSDDPGDVFDVAETYGSLEPVSPGDIVRVGRENPTATSSGRFLVAKTAGAYDETALGIVSTKPALAIRDSELILSPNRQAANAEVAYVALAGRVWTRVSAENGAIRPGDLITASAIPGVGMRASEPGRVLGMALGRFDGPGEGRVMVFVNPHFWGGSGNGIVSQALVSLKASLRDLGLIVREGALEAKELIAAKLTAKKVVTEKLEMKDAATGETYCVRIVRGEFEKARGVCPEELLDK